MIEHNTEVQDEGYNRNRKLYAGLLIGLLVVFVVVYNRAGIANWIDPKPVQRADAPNLLRAANSWNKARADSCAKIVQDGDLVLRSGSDAISNMFKKANSRDKSYSHAGIVFIENGYPFVYHSTGTSQDPEALLRRDSIVNYIGPYDNLGYAVYRYRLSPQQIDKLHDVTIRYFKEGRKFDPYFDLNTDSSLYCTEFVYKAMIETTGNPNYLSTTKAVNFNYIAVDNLFSRKDMKMICRISYVQ